MSSPVGDLPIEVLVEILKAVPIRDLLLSQRVCRQWRSVITDSHELQEALFLRPLPGPFKGWKRTYTRATKKDPTSGFTFQPTRVQGLSQGLVQFKEARVPPRSSLDELGRDEVAFRLYGEIPGEAECQITYKAGAAVTTSSIEWYMMR